MAAHASSRLELLSHGLLLGKQLSDLFYELLNKQLQQQKQQRNTHGNIISGMSRLTHIFEGGSYDKEVVGSNNDEKGIWLGSHEDILRTTTDVMGAIIGISIAYLNGIFMSAYMSCSIGATLITDSTLTLISELLIDPPHTSTSSTSTSITNFFVKIGFRKEENSMISSSVRVKISQYLQSPTVSIVLKSLLIAYGLSRVPFHRITFLENALLSPLLSIERSLNICLFFLKTC